MSKSSELTGTETGDGILRMISAILREARAADVKEIDIDMSDISVSWAGNWTMKASFK